MSNYSRNIEKGVLIILILKTTNMQNKIVEYVICTEENAIRRKIKKIFVENNIGYMQYKRLTRKLKQNIHY